MKTDLQQTYVDIEAEKASRGGLYLSFVSVKTTLIFLGVFAALFSVGTVFPQSPYFAKPQQFEDTGGKLARLAEAFDLLNLTHSWYFLLLAGLFALHLFLCGIHRVNIIRRRPKYGLFMREDLLQREHSFSITVSCDNGFDIERRLRLLGLKRIRYYSENAQAKRVVAEKGIPFRWFSWIYHLCIFSVITGLAVSSLLAFEDRISLSVGERKQIRLDTFQSAGRKITESFGLQAANQPMMRLEIEMTQVSASYVESPRLLYPEKAEDRFRSAWGAGKPPQYHMSKRYTIPGDWSSVLSLYRDDRRVKQKVIKANSPLRYAGIAFYQLGYQHHFDLRAGDELLAGLMCGQPFSIPQMEGQFLMEAPRAGVVHRYGGATEVLAPSAKLKYRPPGPTFDRSWMLVAELAPDQPAEVMHTRMILSNVKHSGILAYRYDPGLPLLWVSAALLLIFMALRIYLPWYQVHCYADLMSGRALVTASIRMVGLFARPERLKNRICDAFRR